MKHLFSFTFLAALPMAVLAAEGHQHGIGTLEIVLDKNILTISAELPLDSMTGFERAPRTDKERATLSRAAAALADSGTLFWTNAEAACTADPAQVAMPFANGRAANGDHADADAQYRFRCDHPEALREVGTRLFTHFPRLYRLDVQRIGPKGQGAGRLTPKQSTLRW